MKEYGYVENGYLRSRFIEPVEHRYTGADGKEHIDWLSVEEQISQLSAEWKPVDAIDNTKVEGAAAGYVVIPVPYDAGDHIAYNYVSRRDIQGIRADIQALKDSLAESDYKVVKCYEASLTGEELPYDIAALHAERQAQRDKINELEAEL